MSKFSNDSLSGFQECQRCHAPLEELIIGGVGDWKSCIMCGRCMYVRRGVPFAEVIVPLAARQEGVSETRILERWRDAQREHEEIILGNAKGLPAPKLARWLASRRR